MRQLSKEPYSAFGDSINIAPVMTSFLLALVKCSLIVLLLSGWVNGQADAGKLKPADQDFFEKSIRPLLVKHCLECHGQDEISGGLRLDSRKAWIKGGDSGDVIVPGKPAESLLVEAISYGNRDLQMPPKNRLTDREIQLFKKWIQLGAPDPREGGTSGLQPTGMSIEKGRQFWSFRPLNRAAVPVFDRALLQEKEISADWISGPIDAFVLQKLLAVELSPASPASRADWIRRATFDMTGLPPSYDEVQAFVADSSPDAHEKVVDRLLASPQYGIRWGRHWLDVARYADSNGLDENLAFGQAWRFRDYTINSFNSDLPFDQWLTEQLAGDLVRYADQRTKTATGFLALGAKVLAEPDREKLEMDTIDEQLDTTGKAFLGLSIGCARCHDHKFDPLKQNDYYALAAIFKSTQSFATTNTGAIKHWFEYSFPSDQERAELKSVEAEIAAAKQAAAKFKNEAIGQLRLQARQNAVEYLVNATRIQSTDSLKQIEEIARDAGLHPRILHHCRLHLQYRREDEFFRYWHQHQDSIEKIRDHYQAIVEKMNLAIAEKKKNGDKGKDLADPVLESARVAIYDTVGFLTVPPKVEFAFDKETLAAYYKLMEKARILESNGRDATTSMGVTDGVIQDSIPVHIRGSHLNLGEAVSRGFPEVFFRSDRRPFFQENTSGRLELARWMVNTQRALTARVYVNRIWRWHFGRGLVRTTENFGALGDPPSHPELLDWLAQRLIQSGWSTKQLHRWILLSSTYRSSVNGNGRSHELDPDNQWLSRFSMRRLEAEEIRDSILSVSGRLDHSMGGKTVPLRNRQFVFDHTSVDHTRYDSLRRAVYLPVIRNHLYPMFEQFDYPDPTLPTGNRNSTTIAPQALLLLNTDLVMDSANELAMKAMDDSSTESNRCEWVFLQVFGRKPSQVEKKQVLDFVKQIVSRNPNQDTTFAWALVAQSLMNSNEFLYVN